MRRTRRKLGIGSWGTVDMEKSPQVVRQIHVSWRDRLPREPLLFSLTFQISLLRLYLSLRGRSTWKNPPRSSVRSMSHDGIASAERHCISSRFYRARNILDCSSGDGRHGKIPPGRPPDPCLMAGSPPQRSCFARRMATMCCHPPFFNLPTHVPAIIREDVSMGPTYKWASSLSSARFHLSTCLRFASSPAAAIGSVGARPFGSVSDWGHAGSETQGR